MVKMISLDQIDASDRLRPIDTDHVELIAASIADRGLQQPVVVRSIDGGYRLTAGGHRLAALTKLGKTTLEVGREVIIREASDLEARIDEIDENLARHELNALDRAIFLAERKKLYEQMNPEAAHGKASKAKALGKSQTLRLFTQRFTKDVAGRVGLSERAIQLAVSLAEKLDAATIEALRNSPLRHNQRELLALAEIEPEQQRHLAALIRDGEAKTVAQAKVHAGLEKAVVSDPQSRLYATLLDAWSRADSKTRAAFMAEADLIFKPKA